MPLTNHVHRRPGDEPFNIHPGVAFDTVFSLANVSVMVAKSNVSFEDEREEDVYLVDIHRFAGPRLQLIVGKERVWLSTAADVVDMSRQGRVVPDEEPS